MDAISKKKYKKESKDIFRLKKGKFYGIVKLNGNAFTCGFVYPKKSYVRQDENMNENKTTDEKIKLLLDNDTDILIKAEIFNALSAEDKKKAIPMISKELKRELIHQQIALKQSERQKNLESSTVLNSALSDATPPSSSKDRKRIPRKNKGNMQINILKKRIKYKAKTFLELYYNCFEIGRFWSWMREEIIYSYSGLEMDMKLKRASSDAERNHIRKIYHQEISALGVAFDESLSFALLNKESPMSEKFIKSLHQKLLPTEPEHAGSYREIKARFPNTQTVLPNYMKVPALMAELIEKDNQIDDPIEKAFRFHYDLVSIHPFTDGNGRVSRLVMNTILMQNDFPPIIIPPEEKTKYIQALETYSVKGDSVPYQIFLLEQMERALNFSISRLMFLPHELTRHEKAKLRKSARQSLRLQQKAIQRKQSGRSE